jgi:prepilin-type N-terminal cleavage/methylation domain-containing protein
MRETLRKLHQSGKKGFTLAELLIVIAITGILVSFGFVEITKYQRKLKRLEMDNTAREIFVAAQNHLTASKTAGVWQTAYYKDSKVSINTSNEWQQSISATALKDDSISSTEKHDYYYVIYNSSSYQDALTSQKSVLGQLLPFGSVDETVRTDGSYIIVFDAYTESVYGVFYTDKGTITQADLAGLIDNEDNAEAREAYTLSADAKKKYAVGYYGGAVAFKNQTKQLQSPVVHIYNDGVDADDKDSNLAINKNTLEVVIQDPNWTTSNQTTVKITVKQLSTTESDPAEAVFSIAYDSKLGKYTVSSGSSGIYEAAMNNAIIKVDTSATGITYHLCFDDITNRDTHFNDLFKEITPGSDISVMASVMNPSDASVALVSSAKIGNSLFASVNTVDKTSGTYEAVVSTGRHLANLSQRVSGYKADNAVKKGFTLTSASLKNDIDWAAYAAAALTPDKNIVTTNSGNGDEGYDLSDQKFLALENDTLTNFDGKGFTLSNFDISTAAGKNSGLFGSIGKSVKAFTAEDVNLVNFNVSSTGNGDAGTFLGNANKQVTLTNIHSYCASTQNHTSAEEYELQTVSSSSSAGGLVGEIANTATIANCSASVKVQGDTGAAGGLIGSITAGKSTIDQSYVGGKVKDKYHYDVSSAETSNVSGGTAGGFIGLNKSNVTISNSYTTASVYGSQSKGTAGGFVGDIESKLLSVSDVYSTGSVGVIDGTVTAGSFAGTAAQSKFKISKSQSVGVLNKVSNLNNLNTIGSGSVSGGTVISEYDYDELILKAATDNSNGGQASPYSDFVDKTYPYPATGNESKIHYGDYPEEPKATITLTKNIHFIGSLTDDGASQNLAFILPNLHFNLYSTPIVKNFDNKYQVNISGYSSTPEYVGSYVLSTDNCDRTDDGYTCKIEIDADTNKDYFISETSNDQEMTALKNKFEMMSDSNYFNTVYKEEFQFNAYTYPGHSNSQSDSISNQDGSKTPEKVFPINTRSQTSAVTYDNYYKPKKSANSGFIYYETYADGSYKTHGYEIKMNQGYYGNYTPSEEESGDSNFVVAQNFTVEDSGYLFTISKAAATNISEDDIWLTLPWSQNARLSTLLSGTHSAVTNVTDEMATKLGITDQVIYRLNFDDEAINWDNYGWGSSIWSIKDPTIRITMPSYQYEQSTYKSYSCEYYFNPRFADSIRNDEPAPYVIRTAEQLKSNMNTSSDYGWMLNNYGTITQAIDIDMLKYDANPIQEIYKSVTYQGTEFVNADGTHTYPLLSGLRNTFIKSADSSAVIKNLRVSNSVDGNITSSSAIQNASYSNYYGSFIDYFAGDMENVSFENTKLTNVKFESSNYYSGIGIFGFCETSADLNNVSFTNCEISNITANTDNLSLLGNFAGSSDELLFNGISIHDSVIKSNSNYGNASNVGLISGVHDDQTVSDTKINNVKMYNLTSNAANTAIIGHVVGTLSDTTVSDTHIYNEIDSSENDSHIISGQTCGLIGAIGNSDDHVYVDGLNIVKATDNGYGFEMHDLKLNTQYWGVIASCKGTITNSSFNDIMIDNIDSSGVSANLTGSRAYGIIGQNTEYISDFGMANISITNITLPTSTDQTPVYMGIIGLNNAGKIYNSSLTSAARKIDNIKIDLISNLDANKNKIAMNNYAFIGANINWSCTVCDLAITNYTSGGYCFTYSNQEGTSIYRISIGTKSDPAVCTNPYFVGINPYNASVSNVTVYLKNSSRLCESNSGTASGTLNGTPVSN